MSEGLTGDLLWAALVTGLMGFWMGRRHLPAPFALLAVVIKIVLPVVYFAWFYDGVWTFFDDKTYMRYATLFYESGYNPLSILQPEGILKLTIIANGIHILYYWWTLLGITLFGPHYFSPVFLNILLTYVAGSYLYRTCRMAGLSRSYAQGLLLFFLIHPDILAWTSFINLKDIILLTCILGFNYHALRLLLPLDPKPKRWVEIMWLLAYSFVMLWIRFYLPVMLGAAMGAWVFFYMKGRQKFAILAAASVITLFLFIQLLPNRGKTGFVLNPASLAVKYFRFQLTPQPWSIDREYTFLTLPSIFHWLLFFPGILGLYRLCRRYPAFSLEVITLLLLSVVYAVADSELLGPRQRVQLTFIWAWGQYHCLYQILSYPDKSPLPSARGSGSATQELLPE